ncbi:hypothetical protein HN51_053457 [Arachis hypogaea]|uniref:UPF0481 protein At3g47200 n=1 Tax=Arachis hypogaea TaxID=3818 RepID=UPI000DEDBE5A|nr:uncharacterized protein LOC112779810 [Arachis hypogaea]
MAEDAKVGREAKLAQLLNQTFDHNNQISSTPKIQRVPLFWRQKTSFYEYCIPTMISFGPIHHGNKNLKQQGQHLKSQWTSLYIEEYSKEVGPCNGNKQEAANYLYGVVGDNIVELKELFAEDVIEGYNDEELTWMLLEDGCSLLYYMDHVNAQHPEELNLKLDQLMYIGRDIPLLENQLPIKLLQLLSKTQGADLEYLITNFMSMGEGKRRRMTSITIPIRNHILDFLRSSYFHTEIEQNIPNQNGGIQMPCPRPRPRPRSSLVWQTYKNIRDLKKSGIQVKVNKRFGGELTLPLWVFSSVTPYFFRNLIAYEMCPDFRNSFECCCYLSFMDSLIDNAEDVKELRSAGVIQNLVESDEEVAKFFNDIGHHFPAKMFNQIYTTDAIPISKKYIQVRRQIQEHYSSRWRTFLAETQSTYFSSPWSLLAFLAALSGLILAVLQTWYTIHPLKN